MRGKCNSEDKAKAIDHHEQQDTTVEKVQRDLEVGTRELYSLMLFKNEIRLICHVFRIVNHPGHPQFRLTLSTLMTSTNPIPTLTPSPPPFKEEEEEGLVILDSKESIRWNEFKGLRQRTSYFPNSSKSILLTVCWELKCQISDKYQISDCLWLQSKRTERNSVHG